MPTEKQITPDLEEWVKNRVRVYLEAAKYLATCGPYDAEKFEHVQSILAKVGADMSSEEKRRTIASVRFLMPNAAGAGPWDQMKAMEHQSLAEACRTFGQILQHGSPDALLFMAWAIEEMKQIHKLIGETEQ